MGSGFLKPFLSNTRQHRDKTTQVCAPVSCLPGDERTQSSAHRFSHSHKGSLSSRTPLFGGVLMLMLHLEQNKLSRHVHFFLSPLSTEYRGGEHQQLCPSHPAAMSHLAASPRVLPPVPCSSPRLPKVTCFPCKYSHKKSVD